MAQTIPGSFQLGSTPIKPCQKAVFSHRRISYEDCVCRSLILVVPMACPLLCLSESSAPRAAELSTAAAPCWLTNILHCVQQQIKTDPQLL